MATMRHGGVDAMQLIVDLLQCVAILLIGRSVRNLIDVVEKILDDVKH